MEQPKDSPIAPKENATAAGQQAVAVADKQAANPRIPHFRRKIFPQNVVISANDLEEFTQLIMTANDRAKTIELANLDVNQFGAK